MFVCVILGEGLSHGAVFQDLYLYACRFCVGAGDYRGFISFCLDLCSGCISSAFLICIVFCELLYEFSVCYTYLYACILCVGAGDYRGFISFCLDYGSGCVESVLFVFVILGEGLFCGAVFQDFYVYSFGVRVRTFYNA